MTYEIAIKRFEKEESTKLNVSTRQFDDILLRFTKKKKKKKKKKKERNLIPSWAWGFKASDVIRK